MSEEQNNINEVDDFDINGMADTLNQISSEVAFTAYCTVGAGCVYPIADPETGKIALAYDQKQHHKLFNLFGQGFNQIIEEAKQDSDPDGE